MHLHRTHLLIITAFVLIMASPIPSWADGPVPPRSPFRAPPTPTPAPLLDYSAMQVIPAEPQVEAYIPDPGDSQIFLPFVGNFQRSIVASEETLSQPAISSLAIDTSENIALGESDVSLSEIETSEKTAYGGADVGLSAIETSENIEQGEVEDPRDASFVYTLREGDSLNDLALEFGRDQLAMSCARSPEGIPAQELEAGDEIIIPSLTDLCHRVKKGQTLEEITAWYGITAEQLLAAPQNQQVTDSNIKVGQYLLIPDARSRYRDPEEINIIRAPSDDWRYGDGQFIWPIERNRTWVTQSFKHGKHMAVDLGTWSGTKILAADTGTVLKAGWSENGYGYRIVIDHGIDYITLYAHLNEYYVQAGDIVTKGDVIGAVGSTGNSTGPHLHFEIRDYGYLIDPLLVLPEDVSNRLDIKE